MIEHSEWIELHDAFNDIVLIRRSAVVAISKDMTGNTIVNCGSYRVSVLESFNRVVMEVIE